MMMMMIDYIVQEMAATVYLSCCPVSSCLARSPLLLPGCMEYMAAGDAGLGSMIVCLLLPQSKVAHGHLQAWPAVR